MWYNLIHLKFMLIENKFVVQSIIRWTSLKFCRSRIGPKKIHVDHGAKLDAWSKENPC